MATSLYKARPDPELVAMCIAGDATAWETLVRRYRRFIYSIPVKFGLQPQDAADIFQTVCVKWIEHLHELRDEQKLKPWLFTTTTRQCLTLGVAKQREVGATDEQLEEYLQMLGQLLEAKGEEARRSGQPIGPSPHTHPLWPEKMMATLATRVEGPPARVIAFRARSFSP